MTKFVRLMTCIVALALLSSECQSAGAMQKLTANPRRRSNSQRDYGLLGNLITSLIDRWNAVPAAPSPEEEGIVAVAVADASGGAETAPTQQGSSKPKGDSQPTKGKGFKRVDQAQGSHKGRPNSQRDYGLLGNLITKLIDQWSGATPTTATSQDMEGSADLTTVVDGGHADATLGTEAKVKAPATAKMVAEATDDDEDIDLREDLGEEEGEEDVKSSAEDSSSDVCKLSPAQRLKHLIEPFVLNLMVDDGGLRGAVEKLRSWESQERYENLNFIGGGVAAL